MIEEGRMWLIKRKKNSKYQGCPIMIQADLISNEYLSLKTFKLGNDQ